MLASELMAELLKEIMQHGDGEVRYRVFSFTEGERVDGVLVDTDEDSFGHVLDRRFILI